jgi:hypothetical protein
MPDITGTPHHLMPDDYFSGRKHVKKDKKAWCKHIKIMEEIVDGSSRYSWWIKYCQIKKNWKYCPICKAERP